MQVCGVVLGACALDVCRGLTYRNLNQAEGLLLNPTWPLCRATCFPGLSEEIVDELQAKWGNIPRYVLEKVNSGTIHKFLA